MNRIETAVTNTAGQLRPLDSFGTSVPVATPYAVAGVLAGAYMIGAAVGCAEGHCVQDPADMNIPAGLPGLSASDLLEARRSAL